MSKVSLARWAVVLLAGLGLLFALVSLADSWNEERAKNKVLEEETIQIKQDYQKLENQYKKLKTSKRASPPESVATATQTTPKKQAAYVPIGKNNIEKAIYATFWSDAKLLTLVQCESGFNPRAVGYDASHNQYNYGLFQISQFHGWSYEYLINPYNNIKAAKIIYDRQGFSAWPSCSRLAGLL